MADIVIPECETEVSTGTPTRLRAGSLQMLFENGDLRQIRLGSRVVAQRIYFAVRDEFWGTLPVAVSQMNLKHTADEFILDFECRSQLGQIDFSWHTTILGNRNSTIKWQFEGLSNSDFRSNRIGICALHPIDECVGRLCRIMSPESKATSKCFPASIAPDPVFSDIAEMTYELAGGERVRFRFDGDMFETEDQRNWTDASFKTYPRPLRLAHPFRVHIGQQVRQGLELSVGIGRESLPTDSEPDEIVRLSMDPQSRKRIPTLGLQLSSFNQPLTPEQIRLLQALHLSHLRVDAYSVGPTSLSDFAVACARAVLLGYPLEIALTNRCDRKRLEQLLKLIEQTGVAVRRWLLHADDAPCDSLREMLVSRTKAEIATGTNNEFVEINRNRERMISGDAVCFSISPQVHAFDNRSMVENLVAQRWAVNEARSIASGRDVIVSPVTLKPRFNPQLSNGRQSISGDGPSGQPDPRQKTLFGAGWTVGSLKYLIEGSAASATYCQTTGPCGLMEAADLVEADPANPDTAKVFPIYHVFAYVGEFNADSALSVCSSHPLEADALALVSGKQVRIIVANFQAVHRQVGIATNGIAGVLTTKRLNASNFSIATTDPEAFRRLPEESTIVRDGVVELTMSPFDILRIDGELDGRPE